MKAVQIQNVSFCYPQGDGKELRAVDSVSLDVEEGTFVALVGHNGSGKSTLAKLLNGLLVPTEGRVLVYGTDTADDKKIYDVRSKVGMVFQNPDNQMIASNVEDDIAFGPENLGIDRDEIRKRVDWALEKVGMSQFKNATPFKMSGGQKQRLAIAGVLAIKPRVMVLDESTAMLDPKGRDEVMKVVRQLNREEGMTVIHITHYMDEALQADRLVVMNDGAVVLDGKPEEVFKHYDTLTQIKLGVPYITELALELNKRGIAVNPQTVKEEDLIDELCRLL